MRSLSFEKGKSRVAAKYHSQLSHATQSALKPVWLNRWRPNLEPLRKIANAQSTLILHDYAKNVNETAGRGTNLAKMAQERLFDTYGVPRNGIFWMAVPLISAGER
jgi:hypothetical protein